jgi:hypothetical protein
MSNSDFNEQSEIAVNPSHDIPEAAPGKLILLKSNIPGNKGIFSHLDLMQERKTIYSKHREDIRGKFRVESEDT